MRVFLDGGGGWLALVERRRSRSEMARRSEPKKSDQCFLPSWCYCVGRAVALDMENLTLSLIRFFSLVKVGQSLHVGSWRY